MVSIINRMQHLLLPSISCPPEILPYILPPEGLLSNGGLIIVAVSQTIDDQNSHIQIKLNNVLHQTREFVQAGNREIPLEATKTNPVLTR